MKKSVRVFSLFALAFLVSFSLVGITACKNWMTGNLFEEIENEVKVASAEEIEVYVRFADNNFGTVSAKCAAAQLQQNHILVAKQDVEMEVSAIPNNTYGFKKWAAFSSSKLDPKKNISSMVFDDEYMDKFGINELPESVVVFENVEADTTKCKILQPLSDPSDPDAMIVIVPIVARRATLSARNTYPKTGSDGVVRNQRIVLSFDKPMNFETFVTCKNPSGTFDKDYNGNNIYYKKDNNGNITEYFYDWNRERIQISVYDTNEKQVDEDIAYGYFQLPVPDETNPRKIIISPNLANRLPKFAEVNIVISYDVEDSHGYTLTEAIEYYYMVGQSDDTGAPTFTELSGGRPLRGNPKNNSWSDYVGYLDEADAADSLTNVLPPDSTNIDDWTDSVKNKPFTHRITNAIDLHVIIKDKINSELISTTASDADIDHFAVRARHLLYADGTPGTGTVFENIIEKNYEGLKYHSGAKNFEEGEPGDSYDDPEDGYSFPYYLPSSIPDGLIKLEIYAQDVTGNSGESEPFALYVVKDTSAPDIETQTNKILSASTNTLNEWFNARTINQLAFKVNAATPFSDTISTANGIVSVHPKFMTSTGGSSLFWAFGNAPENMAERLPIDNTGAASYDMSKLVSTISEQGAMTFYAQLSDDMDNVSEIKNIPLKIYYDTILPEAATIQTPQEDDKIYPLTGVAAGASGTFFTRSPNLSLVVSATDSGSANVTDVSSGVAGFLVPTTNYNAETLYEALTASNGNLNGLNRATDGASRITLTAGSEANNSKQNHYIYSVDYALNAAAAPTTVTVIQDTTGPGITLTDNASYTYNAEKPLFKANAGLYEKTVESGISGTVKGVSQGAYYYSNAQTSFPFHVTLNNEFGEFDSGAYQFVVKQSDGTEVARGSLNDDINLSAGTFTIVAYDNLGNETTTAPFTVVQDSAAPEITAGAFHIYGRKFGYSTYNTDTTNYRIVNLQFEAKDIEGTNSGIRKLTFTGASFAGSEGAPLVVVAGDKTLTQGTDYIVQTEAPAEGQIPEMANSHIIFTEPRLESSFRVDNIILPAEDGTKIVSLMATDATGNISGVVTAGIFSDSTAPSITSVCDIALAPSIDGTGDVTSATNLAQINVQVIAKDATSGIKRFYIGDTYSEVGIDQNTAPGGISLVSAESKVLANGVELPSAVGAGYIELLSPSISSEDVTYTITNVNVPDTSRQGTKTVYVVLYDNTELRNQNAVSDTIIYDTTGPAIIVEDNASKVYNSARPFYRTTDTEAVVAAQTGMTGRVNGLYEGIYYYNASELGFNFTVSLADENTTDGSSVSGAHIFYVDGNEAAPYQTGTIVTLAKGTHTISAKDKLGNVTTSRTITVDQDTAAPNYGGNFKIHGRRFNENTYNETTSNYQTVNISFTVSDVSGNNTGIRSLTFTGAAFNDVVVKAGGNVLSRNTHYIIPANQSAIIFTNPRSESSFQIENITFSQEDGNRTISLVATDATRNAITPVTSSIYLDTQAPEITSVTAISTDVSIDGTNDNTSATKSQKVNVQIVAKDPTSGIKRIYIGDTASRMNPDQHDVPGGTSLLSSDSKVSVNGTELGASFSGNCITLNVSRSSSVDETFVITNVNLPHPGVQGTQEIFVVLFDDTKLRNQNSVSDTIIYDTTGPAIVVTDGASSTYDEPTLNKYRSNDTLNNVTAVTGGNGNVTGIVTGSYYYSMDESAGFKFNVALVDQNVTDNTVNAEGTASGAYRFYIGDASGNIPEGAVAYESGSNIFLVEGTYTLVAKDKLGNTTTSKTITVVQDKSEPSVSDVVIHGKIFGAAGDEPSTTATKENNVYVTFKTSDMNGASNDTGLLKVTLTGDANFNSAKLYEGDTEVTAFMNAGTNSVDFWFASPITTEKTLTVKDVILTDSDGNKTITVKASDRTAKESSGVSSFIFKDVTAPTVSDVEIISTDEDALHENSHTTVTNDEKVTVLFKAYDVTSGIKKITICDANGNSLLTAGEGGSVVTITHNLAKVTFNGTVSASDISLNVASKQKSDSSEDPFIFEVTNVSMPKVDGNFVQGRNYFLVKVYDDVLNVADEATKGSIIFDNVPPVPKVNMHAPSHFNPYEAYRGVPGNAPQYFVNNTFWKNTDLYYFELSGNDNNGLSSDAVAGFWQGKYQEGQGTESIASGLQSVSSSSTEASYNFYVYDAIGNKSVPSTATNTKVTVKKDASAPIVTFDGFYANGTKLIKDSGLSSSSDTNSATHYYYTNSDTVDLKFKAHDTGVGISYFHISGTINASFKNGSFAETDDNAKIAEFLSKSKGLQVWIDGVQYFRGGYKRSTGEYLDGPDGYGDKAYWDGETQKWYIDSAKTQETQNVYFNCYKDMEEGQDEGTRGFRDFGLYNSIPASATDSVFELRNIDLSCLNQSYLQLNVNVYDHMNNDIAITNKKLIYDANKPEVIKTSFVSSGDVNFTSSDVLTKHNLVVQFKENYNNNNSYSGVKEIELELTSNVPSAVVSTLNMGGFSSADPEDSFKVYLSATSQSSLSSSKYEVISSYRTTTSSVDAGTHTAKIKLTLNPTLAGSSSGSGYHGYSCALGTNSRYLVIHGLTIAGGDADQLETIKVTLKDRAGNVSDNTGNENNVVQIGYDKVAPEMYRTEYCDDSGNLVLVDGVPAVSYFKTVLGNPAVLSTHTQSIPYKNAQDNSAKSRKISVFPNPGKADLEASTDARTGWYAGDDTELVLRFNKNGSGVQKITLNPAVELRGMFFNSYTIDVTIDNLDGKGPQHLAYGPDYVLEDRYQEFDQFFRTLRFTSSSKCPRGNNATVYVKGICLDATEMAATGVYGLWCSNVDVTSFAGATTHYDGSEGNEPGWILCAAMDYDTPEFVNQKVTFTDSSVVSGSTYTDGKTIDLTGRVQSKSLGATEAGTYSSGVWAIHLDNAKIDTANTTLKLTVTQTSETYQRETEPNEMVKSLISATEVTYTFESGKDFSKRFMPGDTAASSEIAEFNRNIKTVSAARYSVSDDGHTMYLNMPIDPLQGYDFKISNLQLDPAPMADGAVNITATLYKYSGLSNDSENRIYVRGADKNPAASGKDYVVYRRKLTAVVDGSSESRNSAAFKINRTNSITLDTVPPEITWYDASNKDSNYFRLAPQDEQGRTVYYAGSPGYSYINFNFQDDSGIKGFAFTDTATAPTRPSDFYIANTQEYDIYYFNGLDESLNVVKYIHVMDYTGHVTSRPVTYLDSEDSVPTTWKVDNTKPSVRTVTRHYYGDTAETRYVLKLDSTNSSAPKLNVYKGVSGTLSGKFTDSYVTFDASTQEYKDTPGNLNDFFVESGSGLYGTCKTGGLNSAAEFGNIYVDGSRNPDFTWKTSDSYFKVMDKVGRGCEKSIGISSFVDSTAPTLGITRITAPDGKSVYRASQLSTDSTSPSVIYLNSESTDDGVEITFSAKDTGENATGVYKVTVGGEGLTSGAEGASAKLENITSLTTSATTVTWNLGKGEAKTDGNGLLRSITITDWVGNEKTYWFKLVSDVTAPVLTVGDNSPFTEHAYENTNGNKYFTQFANGKQVIFFSENNTSVPLGTPAVSESGSGYGDLSNVWYSDEACTTSVNSVTFGYAWQDGTVTVAATPDKVYTRDNVGNVLKVEFTKLSSDVEDITTVEGDVLFCFASANTTAKLNVQEGQYVDGTSEVDLSSATPVTIFTKAAETKVKITPTEYSNIKYSYVKDGSGEDPVTGRFKSTRKSVEITVPAGETYNITIGSTKFATVKTTYQVQVVQDAAKPDPSTFTFEIEKNAVESNREDNPSYKSYLDQANWKLYYNTPNKFYPHFKVSGINDGTGSGVAKIGLNNKTTIPGSNFFDVGADGTVSGLWGSFQGNMSGDNAKALYVSDKVGNGSTAGDYVALIEGVVDQTAPTISWNIDGLEDDKKYTTGSGNDTVVYVNSSNDVTVSVADNEGGSGLSGTVTSPVSFDANKEVNLAYSDNVANESKIKIVSDVDAPLVGSVTYDNASGGEHTYSFVVKETGTGVTKIVLKKMEGAGSINSFNSVTGISNYEWTKDSENKTVTITFATPVKMDNQQIVLKMWNGHHSGDWSEADIVVNDYFNHEGVGSAAPISGGANANILSFIRGPKSSKRTARKSRSVVIPENRDVANVARSSGKTSGTVSDSSVMAQTENQRQTPAAKVSDVTVKKGRQDLRKRAAEFEKSEGIISAIPEIQTVEQTLTDIIEETTERGEITTSENISKEVEIFDKNIANNGDDVYNDSNIAKSVVISIILLLIISCSIIVFWALRKRASGNKKN